MCSGSWNNYHWDNLCQSIVACLLYSKEAGLPWFSELMAFS